MKWLTAGINVQHLQYTQNTLLIQKGRSGRPISGWLLLRIFSGPHMDCQDMPAQTWHHGIYIHYIHKHRTLLSLLNVWLLLETFLIILKLEPFLNIRYNGRADKKGRLGGPIEGPIWVADLRGRLRGRFEGPIWGADWRGQLRGRFEGPIEGPIERPIWGPDLRGRFEGPMRRPIILILILKTI